MAIELMLIDDAKFLVENTIASVLREYTDCENWDAITIDKIQEELDKAFEWLDSRPVIKIVEGRPSIEFIP